MLSTRTLSVSVRISLRTSVHIGFARDGFVLFQSRCMLMVTFAKREGAQRAHTSAKPARNLFVQRKLLTESMW